MKVNVLSTVYRIKYVPSLEGRGGETDFYTKEIRISEQEDIPAEYKTDNLKEMQRHVLRHELIHAFLFELAWTRAALHTRHGPLMRK